MARATGATGTIVNTPYDYVRSYTITRSQAAVDVTGNDSGAAAAFIPSGVDRYTANVNCWYDSATAPPSTGANADGFDIDAGQSNLDYDGAGVITEVNLVVPLEDGIEVNYTVVGNGTITISA